MPDEEHNGRITLAVLSTKLDQLQTMVEKIDSRTEADHDRLGKLEIHTDELVYLKRLIMGNIISAGVAMLLALYAVLQHLAAVP